MTEPRARPLFGKKILLLIGGHLATAPRPQKEARVWAEAGAEVLIRGMWWNSELAEEDLKIASSAGVHFSPLADVRTKNRRRFIFRCKKRLAVEWFKQTGWATARTFGPTAPEMLREALRMRPDFIMAHNEGALWAGKKLREKGFEVGVDFEDWFSNDLLPKARNGRPVGQLRQLERWHLRHAAFCFATTTAMARALAEDASTDRLPLTVPNVFPWSERAMIKPSNDLRSEGCHFYWYSQTIGPGRGLETLGQALPRVKGAWHLSLRGNLCGHEMWFRSTFPDSIRSQISLLSSVPNRDLLERHMDHDVGLALESPCCPNRDLTATNKIFDYFRAGLAVIATATQGQREIMREADGAGWVVAPDDPVSLACALQKAVSDNEGLHMKKRAAEVAAKQTWNWENYSAGVTGVLISHFRILA